MDFDLRRCDIDLLQIVGGEINPRATEIFLEPVEFRGSWDRDDPGFLRQQPGERDLRRCRVLSFGKCSQPVHEGEIGLAILLRKTRHDVPEVVGIERGVRIDLAGEKSLAERTERDESDAQFFQRRQDLLFRLTPPQRVLALERRRLSGPRVPGGSSAHPPLIDRSASLCLGESGP